LLGRKVLMEGGKGLALLGARIEQTTTAAFALPELEAHAAALRSAWQQVEQATRAAWASGQPAEALANAVPYMQAFGHTVLAWIWLDVAMAASTQPANNATHQGRIAAAQFFFHYELPKIGAWLQVVSRRDMTCAHLPEEAF
jgi:butyryl-CoA dehydrogenase